MISYIWRRQFLPIHCFRNIHHVKLIFCYIINNKWHYVIEKYPLYNMCVRGIKFVSFYNGNILFWNCSDHKSEVLFASQLLVTILVTKQEHRCTNIQKYKRFLTWQLQEFTSNSIFVAHVQLLTVVWWHQSLLFGQKSIQATNALSNYSLWFSNNFVHFVTFIYTNLWIDSLLRWFSGIKTFVKIICDGFL